MSKRKKQSDNPDQLNIFDMIQRLREPETGPSEASLNVQAQLRAALTKSIKRCTLSRWEIAGRMSMLVGQEISKYMLDTWTAESKEGHRFPAEYLPAFCEATGSHRPLRILAQKAGVFVLPGPDALRSEIQKLEEDIKSLQEERRRCLVILEEVDDG